jgi:hypothetical protein
VNNELLSQLVELTSVSAAGKQLKKPIIVPRPDHVKRRGKALAAGVENVPDNAFKQGIAVLQATSRKAVTA